MALLWTIVLWRCAGLFKRLGQTMIVKDQKMFLSTTVISVLVGAALAIAYMATNEQEDAYLLVLAQFVVVASLLGWLFGMLLLTLPAVSRYLSKTLQMLVSQRAYLPDNGPDWEMIRLRREMIAIRLGADEPLFCSKHGVTCNCWSFCGGDPEISIGQSELDPDYLVSLAHKKIEAEAEAEDRNMSDCSFQ